MEIMGLTEKQKKCKYCHNYFGNQKPLFIEQDAFGFTYFYVNKIEKPDGSIVKRQSNYCEQCGRPLNGDEDYERK